MIILFEVIAGLLFVGSSGIFFYERFRHNRLLVVAAGCVVVISTVYLGRQIAEDFVFVRTARQESSKLPSTSQTASSSPARPTVGESDASTALNFPTLTGRVVDDADILSAETRATLASQLAEHEKATTNQVVVVTLKSLRKVSIEQYGYLLGRTWGIGQRGKDNGVLLIVAPNERNARIEVGLGLERKLSDTQCKSILETDMIPAFRHGDYNGGVIAGVAAVLKILNAP